MEPARHAERFDAVCGPKCRLEDRELHVWFASLRVSDEALRALDRSLAPGERARAERFRHQRDRRDFLAAHGIAREILARYTGMEPRELCFEQDEAGKPALVRAPGAQALGFSMSHSGSAALYGVARERDIGVDIELVDLRVIDERVSERILSPSERAALDARAPAARPEALFRLWTLKEAFLKARGDGLAVPPAAVDTATAAEGRWTLASVPVSAGYAAAAACRGIGYRITCRTVTSAPGAPRGERSPRASPG